MYLILPEVLHKLCGNQTFASIQTSTPPVLITEYVNGDTMKGLIEWTKTMHMTLDYRQNRNEK